MTQKNRQQHAAPEAEQSVQGAVRRSGPDPAKTYHGKPCRHCEETLRWRGTRHCVACDRVRKREWHHKKREDPEWVARNAQRTREWNAALDHVGYYTKQLYNRRWKALKQKEKRHGSLSDEG